MKLPHKLRRQLLAQKKEKVAEGELEETTRKREWTGAEKPEKKRTLKRSLRSQARASGNLSKRYREFPYNVGDLVEFKRVPWGARGVTTGSFGIVVETIGSGERVEVQVGSQVISCRGVDLRMPWEDEEGEE
tara:strand:- start:5 stop:400 length:396 start_codon:yes stop_codon:yes gene_type:complete